MKLIFIFEFNHFLGGASHSLKDILNMLSDSYEICIVAPYFDEMAIYCSERNFLYIYDTNLQWSVSFKNPFQSIYKTIKIQNLILGCVNKDDIIIVNGILTEFILGAFKRLSKFKRIYFVRGEVGRSRLWSFMSFSGIESVICVSSYCKSQFLERFPNFKKNVYVLNNSIHLDAINQFEKNLNLKSEFIICSVGFFHPNKNQELLLNALHILIQEGFKIRVEFYGEAASEIDIEYKKILHNIIDEKKLNDYVKFMGYCDKSLIYSNVDLLVSTSKSEGFGKSILEAMAYKIPVIAYAQSGGPKDIIDNNQDGILLNNYDPQTLADAIKYLYNNPHVSSCFVARAHNKVFSKFSQESWLRDFKLITGL